MNEELYNSIQQQRNPFEESEKIIKSIEKYSLKICFFTKQTSAFSKLLLNIIKSEQNFFNLIESQNFAKALFLSLKFISKLQKSVKNHQNIEKNAFLEIKNSKEPENIKENDLMRLLVQSKDLANNISNQREKISKISKKVEDSLEKSKIFINSFEVSELSYKSLTSKDYAQRYH